MPSAPGSSTVRPVGGDAPAEAATSATGRTRPGARTTDGPVRGP